MASTRESQQLARAYLRADANYGRAARMAGRTAARGANRDDGEPGTALREASDALAEATAAYDAVLERLARAEGATRPVAGEGVGEG